MAGGERASGRTQVLPALGDLVEELDPDSNSVYHVLTMIKHILGSLVYFTFRNLSACERIAHGAFTRLGGVSRKPFDSLNTSFSTGDKEQAVSANLELVSSALDVPRRDLVVCNLEHGDRVLVVTRDVKFQIAHSDRACSPSADAMITNEPGCFLTMSSADCAMVLLLDPRKMVVGLAHAGWKGIVKRMAAKTISAMEECFGSHPEDLLVGVTPSIGPCCYRIKNPMQKALPGWGPYLEELEDGRTAIDLRQPLYDQLLAEGVGKENIELSRMCTSCNTSMFFSFWAEKPKTGRMATVIGIRQEPTMRSGREDAKHE